MHHKCIKLEDRETQNCFGYVLLHLIFDFIIYTLKYIKDKNYIDILIDRIDYKNEDTRVKMEQIRKCAKEYLNSRLGEKL